MNKKDKSTRFGFGIIILVVMVAVICFGSLSCVQGLNTIGWSGGAVDGDFIYVGSEEGRLVSVDLMTGDRQWAEALKSSSSSGGLFGCTSMASSCGGTAGVAIYGTPAIGTELVYIAGYNGKVYAYTKESLALRWVYPRDSYLPTMVGSIIISDDVVYIGTSGGKYDGEDVGGSMLALDANTGDPIWDSPFLTDDKIWSTSSVNDGTIYIGCFDKNFYAIDAATGTEKWRYTAEGSIVAEPLVVDDIIYFGALDRKFYALNSTDGSVKWTFPDSGNWFWSKAVLLDGKIYAGNLDGKVYVLDSSTGNLLNSFDLEESLAASPVVNGTDIIFATRKGAIYTIDTVSNQANLLVTIEDVTINGPLAISDGIVYAHTQDSVLRRINVENGALLSPISLESST